MTVSNQGFETVEFVLERAKYGARGELDQMPALRDSLELYVEQTDRALGRLILSLTAEVQRHKVESFTETKHLPGQEFTFTVPSSVWQHWKQNHAPKWFVTRWPVKYTKVTERGPSQSVDFTVERWATFPESTYAFPKGLGRPVFVQEVKRG